MAVDIDTLQIEVEASSADAAEKVNKLAEALERLKHATTGGGISSVNQRIKNIGASAAASEPASTRSKTQILNNAAQSVNSSVDASSGQQIDSQTEKVSIFRSALEKAQSAGSALGTILKTASSAIKEFGSSLKSVAVSGLKAFGSGFKSVGSYLLSSFTKPFTSAIATITKLKNSLGRIAFYRAVRAAISAVTDGFKTGIENLYQYSKLMGTSFAPAMNSLATSAQYLKNSLGAMAAPLIEAVAPAVDYLIDKFVALLNIIGKVFAALSGKSTYTQAVKKAKEYAEATGGAAEAAQKFLLGIDELTILDNQSGGSSGSLEDYGSMFEEVEVPTDTMDWAQKIRDAIAEGDWRGAGSILAEKLNEVIDGWDSYSWGQKLGKKINNGLNFAYGFMTTFNFKNLGSKIASGLNGIFDTVDWDLVGRTFASKWNALISLIYGFVDQFDWSRLGTSISEIVNGFFDEVDWAKAGQTLSEGISGILTSAITFIEKTDWSQIGQSVVDYLSNIDWKKLLSKVGTLIGDAVVAALEFAFSDPIGLLQVGVDIVSGLLQGILNGLVEIGTWLKENLVDPIVNKVKEFFGVHSPSTVFQAIGVNLILGMFSGISSTWNKITSFFAEKIADMKKSISSALDSIKNTASEKWTSIKTTTTNIWNSMWSNIKGVINSILGGIESMVNGVITGLNKMIGALNNLSFDIPDWVPEFGGKTLGFHINTINTISIPRLENGGFVGTGQMFIARESGPELVGKIGQQTAVANNEQIVEGISSGVKDANEDVINVLYAVTQQIITAIQNNSGDVYLDGQKVGARATAAQNRQNRMYGKTLQNA